MYAFYSYDRMGSPDVISPTDCLAPVLLNVRMSYAHVLPLFHSAGPGANLLSCMRQVLETDSEQLIDFIELDLHDPDGPWQVVDRAISTSGAVKHLKAVAVTKMLHRKRPSFVPIFDREIYRFYFGYYPMRGSYAAEPRSLWPVLQADLRLNRSWLTELIRGRETPDGRELSLLRAADIVVWMHMVTGCGRAVATNDSPELTTL